MSIQRIFLIIAGAFVLLIIGFFAFMTFTSGSVPFLTQTETVTVKDKTFTVEVMKTEEQKQKGLSGRKSLNENKGMLFVFDTPDFYGFWMKDMKMPIDILFINGDKVVTIYKNVQPPQSENDALPVLQPSTAADKVLEIKAGLSDSYGFVEGDTVQTSL